MRDDLDNGADRPDPARARLLGSVFKFAPLSDVAEAVSVASETQTAVYVERLGDTWRWSLIHPGGPHPLLRVAAEFLRVRYTRIFIGFVTVEGGAILRRDPRDPTTPDRWTVLHFQGPSSPGIVQAKMLEALGS